MGMCIIQTCIDGHSWEDISGPMPEREAVAQKHEIDHNVLSCGIDVRIVPA